MKKIKYIFFVVIGGYVLVSAILTPYYNYSYAKNNGFIKWLLWGEIVATTKALIWPYSVFILTDSPGYENESERYYTNSKKACDEGIKIIIKTGDVLKLSSEDKEKTIWLFELSVSEAEKIEDSYLDKIHPEFHRRYMESYIYALKLLIQGLKTENSALVLGGTYGYNEFAVWMQTHKSELHF